MVGDIGSFGGLFDLPRAGVGQGLLVASADGVGTKLEVAKRAKVHHTVGRDLVNHCINDILVQGARPLFFMDYIAVGKMEPEIVAEMIRGCADGCRENRWRCSAARRPRCRASTRRAISISPASSSASSTRRSCSTAAA